MFRFPCHVVVPFLVGLIVVRFDGSLKMPTAEGRARLASAAATLSVVKDWDEKCEEQFLCIGGKHLDTSKIRTSAEVEFEGLILGLEGILAHQEFLTPLVEKYGGIIRVQGDCKTAIQQMQGRSKSRKLALSYSKASELVEKIPWSLQFEHCPREQNALCDRLCCNLLASKQDFVIASIYVSLLYLLKNDTRSRDSLRDVHDNFLIPGKTLLCGTSRLTLYSILARIARWRNDYNILLEIAKRMQSLADVLRAGDNRRSDTDNSTLLRLRVEGIRYEMLALHMLGKEREVQKVQRRERTILLRHVVGDKDAIDDSLGLSTDVCSEAIPSLESAVLEWSQEWKKKAVDLNKASRQCAALASSPRSDKEGAGHPLAVAIRQLLMSPCSSDASAPTWVSVPPLHSVQLNTINEQKE